MVTGTLIDGLPRIIQLNDFRVDVTEGTFLVVTHDDRRA